MNRYKKEQERRRREARKGKTQSEIEALDEEDRKLEEIERLARKLHARWFPEEYDYRYDDAFDREDRAKGTNPMKEECVAEVEARRKRLGVSPLSVDGTIASQDSWMMALNEAERRVGSDEPDGPSGES